MDGMREAIGHIRPESKNEWQAANLLRYLDKEVKDTLRKRGRREVWDKWWESTQKTVKPSAEHKVKTKGEKKGLTIR